MISVIICSINKKFADQVQESIATSIGVTWEAIIIDNTLSPESITRVYNIGAAKAQYNLLCFIHEDILFETKDWGKKLLTYFKEDVALGLIGVAGSKYKSKTPSGWFTGITKLDCCNIMHLDKTGTQQKIYLNPLPETNIQQVLVLDGVFLCCPKQVWQTIKFDDVLLTDFHLYDIDFSFRTAEKFKVIVSYDIDIIHVTKGAHYGDKWLESTLKWHKEMYKKLPVCIPELTLDKKVFESNILRTWLIRLKHENLSFFNKINWLINIKIWKNIFAWPYVVLFLLKSILKNLQLKIKYKSKL